MIAAVNLIRGTVAFVALAILTGAIILNPFVSSWIGGYVSNAKFQRQCVAEARAQHFRSLCTDYYNASYFDRWTSPRLSDMGWCAEYKHRL